MAACINWRLGFGQSSSRHIPRVPQRPAPDAWARPLLFLALLARGFLISFLDNVYHYETPVSDVFYAKNLRLAAPLAKLLLNFNFHGIHHVNPAIPWLHGAAAARIRPA